jgi:uncharacterized protein YdeI (YjbR/CyaY-like superfamily)
MKSTQSIEDYIFSNGDWVPILSFLRDLILQTQLEEQMKWGIPTYSFQGKNLVGIAAFKNYVSLWFHQGALLQDEQHKLMNAQEGVTKALRQWRFKELKEALENESIILSYLEETIQNQANGLEIKAERLQGISIHPLLLNEFSKSDALKTAFDKLTPGRQNEYVEYLYSVKREETRLARLDKIIPSILSGKGLNDKYMNSKNQ